MEEKNTRKIKVVPERDVDMLVRMRWGDGMTYDEICTACGYGVKASSKRHYDKLKKHDYYGRDPYNQGFVKYLLNNTDLKFQELAKIVGAPTIAGFKNYVLDRGLQRTLSEEKVIELRAKGWYIQDIADYYGITVLSLYRWTEANGVAMNNVKPWTEDPGEIVRIREKYLKQFKKSEGSDTTDSSFSSDLFRIFAISAYARGRGDGLDPAKLQSALGLKDKDLTLLFPDVGTTGEAPKAPEEAKAKSKPKRVRKSGSKAAKD